MSASRGRWTKLLALAGLVALLSVFITPARADAVEAPIFHWNMKGGCKESTHLTYPGACGSENRAYWLAWLLGASSWTPWTITLNEVCAPQFMRLAVVVGVSGSHGRSSLPDRPAWSTHPGSVAAHPYDEPDHPARVA